MWKEWVERCKTWLTGEGKLVGDMARSPDLPNDSKWFYVIYDTVTMTHC